MIEKDFKVIVNEIKIQIDNTKREIFQNANMSLLNLYFYIGKVICDNATWGNKFVDDLAIQLKISYPNMKGFSSRNLQNMKKYYLNINDNEILQKASAKIPWSHNMLILDRVKDDEQRIWYMNQTEINGWGYYNLMDEIKYDAYSRQVLGDKPNNFNSTLSSPQNKLVFEMMKDPYIFDITTLKNDYLERELESAMVEKIKMILLELGNGFSFVGNQYKLEINHKDYYIDLLFYHLKLHCYIVVELKNTEFKPEYVGKVNFYLSAVDDSLKDDLDNPTIGLILCKEKDKLSVEYALKDVHKPIGVSSYELTKYLPKNFVQNLPTEEDINLHLDIND